MSGKKEKKHFIVGVIMVAIIVAMLLLPIQNTFLGVHPKLISDILIWISVVFTIISGVDYIAKNWNLMEMK